MGTGPGIEMRVGSGLDVHAFAEGRRLVLGGVEIPHALGLGGHSDADVVGHAVGDALLGAACLGDLGQHFPGTPEFEGISSMVILERVAAMLVDQGWRLQNVDITVVAQEPRLSPHKDQMTERIAKALGVLGGQVSLKATTADHLGFTGRREGVACHAVALISRAAPGYSAGLHSSVRGVDSEAAGRPPGHRGMNLPPNEGVSHSDETPVPRPDGQGAPHEQNRVPGKPDRYQRRQPHA